MGLESKLRVRRLQNKLLAEAQQYVASFFDEYAMIQLLDWKNEARAHQATYGDITLEDGIVVTQTPNLSGGYVLPENYEIQLILPYIKAVEDWKNQVMADYLLVRKPALLAGQNVSEDFSNHGNPPVSFTDMFLIVTPHLRPPGWTYPEI